MSGVLLRICHYLRASIIETYQHLHEKQKHYGDLLKSKPLILFNKSKKKNSKEKIFPLNGNFNNIIESRLRRTLNKGSHKTALVKPMKRHWLNLTKLF